MDPSPRNYFELRVGTGLRYVRSLRLPQGVLGRALCRRERAPAMVRQVYKSLFRGSPTRWLARSTSTSLRSGSVGVSLGSGVRYVDTGLRVLWPWKGLRLRTSVTSRLGSVRARPSRSRPSPHVRTAKGRVSDVGRVGWRQDRRRHPNVTSCSTRHDLGGPRGPVAWAQGGQSCRGRSDGMGVRTTPCHRSTPHRGPPNGRSADHERPVNPQGPCLLLTLGP